jgi:ABC-type uncharacterized transport system ATPase subunit
MMLPVLSVHEVTKKFHQVVANDRVSFDVMPGEIHCLLGENGAGKSTIAECIYGFHRPDGGTISVRGKELDLRSPSDAIHSGIGMVHQHFVLVPTMTVLENIVIGTEAAKAILDMRSATDRILTICRRYDVDIDLNSRVSQLTVGQQQWVEILKALFLGAEILIMDEPTAVLTPQESRRLFANLPRDVRQRDVDHPDQPQAGRGDAVGSGDGPAQGQEGGNGRSRAPARSRS